MRAEKLQLTGIFVQDHKNNGFTAFFAQFPNIIAEGDTQEEAASNLIHTVQTVFDYQKNQELNQSSCLQEGRVITQSFNLEFA